MPKFTALLHTHNDALRLGRALQSLRPCDQVLVIDENSEDDTEKVAREYGATFKTAIPGVSPGAYAVDAEHEWILCLRPNESLSDTLEAALLEWREQDPGEGVVCYSVPIRKENGKGWKECPAEVRLVNRNQVNWIGEMPPENQNCARMHGELLSFQHP
jgi:glycosyltransferase involved in cell wall biosynthesis